MTSPVCPYCRGPLHVVATEYVYYPVVEIKTEGKHWIVHKRAEHSASFMESESLHCMECTTDIPVEECLPEPPKKEEENAEV